METSCQDNVSLQEIKSGLEPGQQVVTNALVLDHVLASVNRGKTRE